MGTKDSFGDVMMSGRTLIAILIVAIVWRAVISLDGKIDFWPDSVISGISLFIFGWVLFAYLYRMSRKETGWLVSNRMFQGLAVSLSALNIYVMVYYGMRWYRLASLGEVEEALVPLDWLLRDVRYVMLVLCYCGLIWAARYLKKMHDNYMLLTEEVPTTRKGAMRTTLFKVLTDERTAIVIIAIAFFWRAVISLGPSKFQIAPWESMVSGIAIFIMGWVLFGYTSSLAARVVSRPNMVKIYHGIALALFAVNIYALVYYGMRWYRLIVIGGEAEVPLDYVWRDIRYFMLVIFYCATLVLSKWLETAAVECEFLVKKEESMA
ncbi:MAG: hypothetical protein JW878_07135 [Methanomicrobia archaeon]|nr:hypothetical protein [Methanomicrobia archaeon]